MITRYFQKFKYNAYSSLSPRKYVLKKSVFEMSTATQEHNINIKGQTINYIKVGEGSKVLFCLPGALGSIWSDFKPQLTGFDASKFTTIVWDPPGYGRSRPPNKIFNERFYETDADYAFEFMKELGVNKYSLLGWSDGGITGMIMAAKYPENINNLVIWGANAYILPEERDIYQKMRDLRKWSEKMKAPLIDLYTEDGLQKLWNSWCDTLIKIYDDGGNICKEYLHEIKCPTLILHGDRDPMVAPEHPEFLVSNIKNQGCIDSLTENTISI